jgi:uncharacterized protein YaiE (UPF0345 family)
MFMSFVFINLQAIIYTGREAWGGRRIMGLRKTAPAPVQPRAGMPAPQKFSDSTTNRYCSIWVSQTPCSMGPGSLITVNGSGLTSAGIVATCDCTQIIVPSGDWTNTRITGYVYSVAANFSAGIQVETSGGTWSASGVAPYTALAAQITKVVVGSCTYIPDQSPQQCLITAGTQFTIYGNYFGAGPLSSGPQVTLCDCSSATINSWDPGWTSNPSATGNVITATAVDAECGNSIVVYAEAAATLPSNPVPYTTCQ